MQSAPRSVFTLLRSTYNEVNPFFLSSFDGDGMTRVVLDESLRSLFCGFSTMLEVCDSSGRVVGRFVPSVDYEAVERTRPAVSEEELDRRNQSRSFSTAEVLARLQKLERP
jgi:hypothetical protein